jgi:hypothetical protein
LFALEKSEMEALAAEQDSMVGEEPTQLSQPYRYHVACRGDDRVVTGPVGKSSRGAASKFWSSASLNDSRYRYMTASLLWQWRGIPNCETRWKNSANCIRLIDLRQLFGGA